MNCHRPVAPTRERRFDNGQVLELQGNFISVEDALEDLVVIHRQADQTSDHLAPFAQVQVDVGAHLGVELQREGGTGIENFKPMLDHRIGYHKDVRSGHVDLGDPFEGVGIEDLPQHQRVVLGDGNGAFVAEGDRIGFGDGFPGRKTFTGLAEKG